MQEKNQVGSARGAGLIKFEQAFTNPLLRAAATVAGRTLGGALGFKRINAIYSQMVDTPSPDPPFNRILRLLDLRYRIGADDLVKIPKSGPLVVIANHPFGGIEGIILADLLMGVRPATKVLGNYLLGRISPVRDAIIPVDPFARRSSIRFNARSFRTCLRWLKDGNCLIVFPAGEVAHYSCRQRKITDPPWSTHIASLVRMSGARVLPVFFPGRNSILFNLLGLIHPRLRTLMLPREMMARKSLHINLFIGNQISVDRMKNFQDDGALTRWLRFRTYILANRMIPGDIPRIEATAPFSSLPSPALVAPVRRSLLAAEVDALPEWNRLISHKQMLVLIAESDRIPHLLREIGRLREKTFREVGEGTGKTMDVDLFDSYYRHLILWNHATEEVVGAYRIGDTGEILARFGRNGLYTHSLFRFKSGLLNHLNGSLELGRSFIRSEYQRQPNCLSLLWKGIGAYLVRHPVHRILFGPVSISNSYHRISKQIMIQFLRRNCASRELSAHVSPRCPFRMSPERKLPDLDDRMSNGSIDDVSMLISEIESDGKRVPVLIKHYLKLNGQFVAFNVDRDFSNAVDGLVVVDLMKTEARLLDRFMGAEGSRSYREYWSDTGRGLRSR